MKGGYQPITPIQIGNLLHAYQERRISWQAVRLALASVEMLAIREASKRSRPKWKNRPVVNQFTKAEFAKLTGLNMRAIGRGLGDLVRAGLLEFSPAKLSLKSQPVAGAEPVIEGLSNGRGSRRLIPIPRPVLRFLAREPSATLAQVMIAYWVRGLSLQRATCEIRSRGTVKASWISELFSLSLRAVRYAQAKLRVLGWIGKDTGSKQWKLNRDGAYFIINLDWNPTSVRELGSSPLCPHVARPPGEVCIAGAPPREDKFSPSESKNQIALPKAGFCLKESKRRPIPNLSEVRAEDLLNVERLRTLFGQAVRRGWLRPCVADELNFFGAAVRALQVPGEGPRIFSGIIRKRLWGHITAAQEDAARRLLAGQRDAPSRQSDLEAVKGALANLFGARGGEVGLVRGGRAELGVAAQCD
ncbi:MAG: hypothetical protein U1G08_04840 [Verrucomicrobiota bacterium]